MPSNAFIQNSLISAVFQQSNVSILLSGNREFNSSLKSSGLLAPFGRVEIRAGLTNSNYANYMIIDNTVVFLSESVTGRVFKNSLGIGLIAEGEKFVEPMKKLFLEEWKRNTFNPFENETWIDIVYAE